VYRRSILPTYLLFRSLIVSCFSLPIYNVQTHNLAETDGPKSSVECTREEMLSIFELMYTMRRMEITCDNEYKARNIRGFCHLYDGQEAVATGIQYALDPRKDSWITSYRCHCVALARGGSVKKVVGELFGVKDGMTQGKGGSMHFYNKNYNFFGGQGIVGAQVPVGTGLAFAAKVRDDGLSSCDTWLVGRQRAYEQHSR
jgi:pyruvate dehydrogenase E1 component alpha subunit